MQTPTNGQVIPSILYHETTVPSSDPILQNNSYFMDHTDDTVFEIDPITLCRQCPHSFYRLVPDEHAPEVRLARPQCAVTSPLSDHCPYLLNLN